MIPPRRLPTDEAVFTITEEELQNIKTIPFQRGGIAGQNRAVESLEMGLEIRNKGYNIFVTGQEGTGRRTAIYNILRERSASSPSLGDVALVYNFKYPEQPVPLYFERGGARRFQGKLRDLIGKIRREMEGKPEALKQGKLKKGIAAFPKTQGEWEELKRDYSDPKIHAYLNDLIDDASKNPGILLVKENRRGIKSTALPLQYEINILKDGSLQKSTPIICEEYPTYQNLFGFIVSPTIGGRTFQPSHLDVKGGNFLQASGGFLLLDAEDLLKEKQAWKYLKRTLKTGFLAILPEAVQPKEGRGNVIPKNIAVDVKVILIGSEDLYENLFSRDPEFSRLFKVSADFDTVMPRTAETMGGYLNFIEVQSCENGIRPMDMGGKAEVIRYGTKLAEDRSKLTTRFEEILDLIVEAEYWAKKKDSPIITGKIIRETLEKRHYRSNMAEEKINELIADGDIYIPLREPRVGQINALAIHERGFLAFGTPCLISAKTSPGDAGIINIDGEAGLSGEIHDKWIYILEGYLRHNYTSRFPLTLYATICFEQSYGEIDGDSAAAAEMCALLSSISEVPLRQTIAVTGSLSQTGLVQPVGGITEKVAGFFSVCCQAGLTGEQGVILPRQNVKNLILPPKVEAALKKDLFHLYPVETLNEALEILSGIPPGEKDSRGIYPAETFNFLVEKRLKQLHFQAKNTGP